MNNWHKNCINILNKQIQIEYWASYQYHIMWSYFDRNSVGLKNIANFFMKSSEEEREHAHKLMNYQNMRGGIVQLTGIEAVNSDFLEDKNNDVLKSFEMAYKMEDKVYKSLLEVHKVAEECDDPQFADFIEGNYLEEQVEAMDMLQRNISQLKRIGNDGHGIWNFDQNFNE